MSAKGEAVCHVGLMDAIYRRQRHIYDLTRRYFLLGRDTLIAELDVPAGASVLEIACGTGRNLIHAAQRYPEAEFFGIDISAEMLATAERAVVRAGLPQRIRLAQADAGRFDPMAIFGRAKFDRVFISYALSMIPSWREAMEQAADCTAPGGSLHVVDFGQQDALPGAFRSGLGVFLERFHVTPRHDLFPAAEQVAASHGARLTVRSQYGDYARHVRIRMLTEAAELSVPLGRRPASRL